MRKKMVGAVGSCLWAALALVLTTSLIAEISATPTWDPGIDSSTWTPTTAASAVVFGHGAFHGDLAPASILFGWFAIAVVSLIAGLLGAALIVYCLGRRPRPFHAALLGAAWGLAVEILLINLLLNWVQSENGLYRSLPSWAWWIALGTWGAVLGLALARNGRRGEAAREPVPDPLPADRPSWSRPATPASPEGGIGRHSPLSSADGSLGTRPPGALR